MEGGHFVVDVTVKKILDAIYWWPIIFKDIHEFCRSYDSCKRTKGLKTKNLAKLVIIVLKEPFRKLGLHFIGLIKPIGRGSRYILVAINYVTKWVEIKVFKTNIAIVTT